jgi:hypothetical protein
VRGAGVPSALQPLAAVDLLALAAKLDIVGPLGSYSEARSVEPGDVMVALVRFASIFLLGLVSGVSFSHLLQRGPKKTLPAAHFLAVQQVLLRNYGPAIGGLEVVQQDCQFADTRIAPLELGRLRR